MIHIDSAAKDPNWRPYCSECKREAIKWVTPKTGKPAFKCTHCRAPWDGSELTPAEAQERDAAVERRKNKICKALSLRQPWAWVVVYLGKDVENRGKEFHYRGPLFIHASRDMTKQEYQEALDFCHGQGANTDLIPSYHEILDKWCGGIVGSTYLYDAIPRTEVPDQRWHMARQVGHLLRGTKPIDFFPCQGNQGIWEAEYIYDAIVARDATKKKLDTIVQQATV